MSQLPNQLDWIRGQIDRMLHPPGSQGLASNTFFEGWNPTLDIYEDREKVTVQAQLPGMRKEEIDVSLHGNTLSISGERKHEVETKDEEMFRSERLFGRFQRTIALPTAVDASQVQASYKDGILTITCLKPESAKCRQINVKTE